MDELMMGQATAYTVAERSTHGLSCFRKDDEADASNHPEVAEMFDYGVR